MKNLTVDYGTYKITYSSETSLILNKFIQLPENDNISTNSSLIRFIDWLYSEGYKLEIVQRERLNEETTGTINELYELASFNKLNLKKLEELAKKYDHKVETLIQICKKEGLTYFIE